MQAILALSNLNAYFNVRCKIERRVYDDVTAMNLSDMLHFDAVIIVRFLALCASSLGNAKVK